MEGHNPNGDISRHDGPDTPFSENEDKYRNIVESSHDGICIIQDAVIQFANNRLARMLGFTKEEVLGTSFYDYVHPDELSKVMASYERFVAGDDREQRYETVMSDGRGAIVNIDLSVSPTLNEGRQAALVMVRDITDLKKMEAEKRELERNLQQTQRMEAIGTLAGGIAHEFNNILWIISANAEYALNVLPVDSSVRKNLNRIERACERATGLVGQILNFSRRHQHRPKPLDMRAIVKETLKFMRASLPKSIEIKTEIASDLGLTMADPTQLHQVVTNLCTNAFYAMHKKGGVLEVTLENVDSSEVASFPSGMARGRYVRLRVKDTGPGMEPAIMKRIFEPFFTTKQVGEGAGLGLSVVYGIVESYNGTVRVNSVPGKGSVFEVFLPIVEDETEDNPLGVGFAPRGEERILFVDDEPEIAESAKEILEGLGYRVDIKTHAPEALALFNAQPDAFALVIADMSMPRMSGGELAREMLRVRADIPIIISTGYGELVDQKRAKEMGVREVIMKPAGIGAIAQAIRRALDNA
ncbi:MAG: ATP-binding protein [Desulfatiglandaceae bacterium]